MNKNMNLFVTLTACLIIVLVSGCGGGSKGVYVNPYADFGVLQNIAVMPFQNLTTDDDAAERVRDAFISMLLATEALYVLPPGEVTRGIDRVGMRSPANPNVEEVKKLSNILQVDAVITGTLREYAVVRSGASSANLVSLSLKMIEVEKGTVIWSADATKGGITVWDRLFGGGGQPMNDVTEEVVDELIEKLFE